MEKKNRRLMWLVLLCALALPFTASAQTDPGKTLVTGQVTCDRHKPLEGCEVVVEAWYGTRTERVVVVTDARGNFFAHLPCPPDRMHPEWKIEVRACCGAAWSTRVVGCPPQIQVPVLNCPDCDKPPADFPCGRGQTLILGHVLCGMGDPKPDCPVRIVIRDRRNPLSQHVFFGRTDACGAYKICVPCPPPDRKLELVVETDCCPEKLGPIPFADCRPLLPLPPLMCKDCDKPQPCAPGETLVRGRVVCRGNDPTMPPIRPMPNCPVLVEAFCMLDNRPLFSAEVGTDPDGFYSVCVPCPVGCRHVKIVATPLCCKGTAESILFDCLPVLPMPDVLCDCGATQPCPPGNTTVKGLVLCAGQHPGTPPTPNPGCPVLVEAFCVIDNRPLFRGEAITDHDGSYSLCVPCDSSCPHMKIVATAQCCNVTAETILRDCPTETLIPDMVCDCGTPQPCPTDHTKLNGRILCATSDPNRSDPAPGCPVHVEVWCGHTVIFSAEVTTDHDGYWSVCAPCGNCPDRRVVVTAGCCTGSAEEMVRGCPAEYGLQDLVCDCAPPPGPCPDPSQTKVSGDVLCAPDPTKPRELVPVPDCDVTITVESCGVNTTYTVITDAHGHYEVCIPCDPACLQQHVTVVPGCCRTYNVVEAWTHKCLPELVMPAAHCESCP